MGHYPALLAVQPETRQLQVPFIAMFYLSHARRWATMEADMRRSMIVPEHPVNSHGSL